MRKLNPNLFAVIIAVSLFLSCTKNKTTPVISASQPTSEVSTGYNNLTIEDVIYANNKNWLDDYQDLDLDVYLPTPAKTAQKFPLVLFIHGGGFTSGDKSTSKADCQILALNGFTVASINYRVGWSSPADQTSATYRALQDAHAALRFLVANADEYSIDTRWIFVEGPSAGAITTLNMAYLPQDSADVYYRSASNRLGPLYSAGNDLTNTYVIRGVASLWGSLVSPYLITKKTYVPTIFFHGEEDNIIPWDEGNFYNDPDFPVTYGSKSLYDYIDAHHKAAVAHIDPKGNHGIYDSDFNQTNVACFFNSIMNGNPQKGIYYTEVPNCE